MYRVPRTAGQIPRCAPRELLGQAQLFSVLKPVLIVCSGLLFFFLQDIFFCGFSPSISSFFSQNVQALKMVRF
jgi:hypothetical protein